MKVAICVKSANSRNILLRLLNEFAEKYRIDLVIDSYASPEHLFFHFEEQRDSPTIIFLDMTCAEIVERLILQGYTGEFIFLSTTSQDLISAVKLDAFYNIINGLDDTQRIDYAFFKALNTARVQIGESVFLNGKGERRNILVRQILYFSVSGRFTTVFYIENNFIKQFKFSSSIRKIEDSLSDKGFIRISKYDLVSARYIVSLQHNQLVLQNGTILRIGRQYYKKLNEFLSAHALF